MNTADIDPRDALDMARGITEFLDSAIGAFSAGDEGGWPDREGWGGLSTITLLLNALLKRAGDKV